MCFPGLAKGGRFGTVLGWMGRGIAFGYLLAEGGYMSGSIEVAKAAFGVISELMGRKRKLKGDLSRQFREALTETEIYWGRLTRKEPRDFKAEADLARKWSQTATTAAGRDKELSDACLSISRFWANPPFDPAQGFQGLLAILWRLLADKREDGTIQMLPMR